MEIFKREMILEKIEPFIDLDVVKILVGMRRCGKSTCMEQIVDLLINRGISKDDIIYIDMESKKAPVFENADELYDHIIGQCGQSRKYILLDEIQNLDGWESCVRALMKDADCDIYLTGSNSKMLSGELATHLSGRYVEIPVMPFAFKEVRDIMGEMDTDVLFRKYLVHGGMPLVVSTGYNESVVDSILTAMYDSVVINDIAERNRVKDVSVMRKVLLYIVSEIGHSISAKRISDYLISQKNKVSVDTVINYMGYAESAMFIRKVPRYDLRGKELMKNECKYYLTDIGIREALELNNMSSIDQVLENVVLIELLNRGYRVYVGKIGDKEIDFVAQKGNNIEYYQVSYLIASEETAKREFGSLMSIQDNFPKYVLSMDSLDLSRDGIVHRNIVDWLCDMRS